MDLVSKKELAELLTNFAYKQFLKGRCSGEDFLECFEKYRILYLIERKDFVVCPTCGLFNCECETSYDHAWQDYMNDIDPNDQLTGELIGGG